MKKVNSIMVVDDSEMDHIIAKFAIQDYDESVEVLSAYDGREALELLDTLSVEPDIIFLDINMPGMNGHEFLVEYAKREQLSIVIAMLTSSDQTEDREKCMSHGFVKKYMVKPLEAEDIRRIAAAL